jgi:alanine racemase
MIGASGTRGGGSYLEGLFCGTMTNSLLTVTVDLKAIDSNIKAIRRLLSPDTKFMAVVKSNAYGHGLFEVSKQAVASGADYLGVVTAEEAIALRKWGIIKPIVVLGGTDKEDVKQLIKQKVGISVFSEESYRMVLRMATLTNQKAIVHVKIDTGLNRLGLTNGDALKVIQKIASKPRLFNLEGLYSHFASVEELNQSYTKDQIRNFEKLLKKLSDLKINIPLISMAGSAAAILHPESHFNCVRIGIAMYGLWPSRTVEVSARRNKKTRVLKLKPALSYKTRLVHVRRIPAGSFVGYGSSFQARSAMTIGVIPVGYYEGLPRSLSNMGFALLKGGILPIIGRVCMNMTILDLSKRPRAKVGDEVVLIGTSKNKEILATDVADWAGAINYQIVSTIPEHIDRVYKS